MASVPSQPKRPRVFISYSTRDLGFANAIRSLLVNVSMDVFRAEFLLRPGAPIAETIRKRIRQAELFILVWSDAAKDSHWVRDEVGIALGARITVLPITLSPGTELPAFIRELKYLDASRDLLSALPEAQRVVMRFIHTQREFQRAVAEQRAKADQWDGLKSLAAIVGVGFAAAAAAGAVKR